MRCPNCGSLNAEDAHACANCGASLRAAQPPDRQETIIDVTSGEPELVEREQPQGGAFQTRYGRARVYVARGPRACLIPVVIGVLVLCLACIGALAVVEVLF